MLNKWMKILPFFVIEWFAKKYCQKNYQPYQIIVKPFEGVYFKVEDYE